MHWQKHQSYGNRESRSSCAAEIRFQARGSECRAEMQIYRLRLAREPGRKDLATEKRLKLYVRNGCWSEVL